MSLSHADRRRDLFKINDVFRLLISVDFVNRANSETEASLFSLLSRERIFIIRMFACLFTYLFILMHSQGHIGKIHG